MPKTKSLKDNNEKKLTTIVSTQEYEKLVKLKYYLIEENEKNGYGRGNLADATVLRMVINKLYHDKINPRVETSFNLAQSPG